MILNTVSDRAPIIDRCAGPVEGARAQARRQAGRQAGPPQEEEREEAEEEEVQLCASPGERRPTKFHSAKGPSTAVFQFSVFW